VPASGENVRFQVLVNGEVKITGGIETIGVLSLTLTWVRRDLSAAPQSAREDPNFSESDWIDNRVQLRLGGLDSATNEQAEWFDGELSTGDKVMVRVLPAGEFDRPALRYPAGEGGCRPRPKPASD
jgi:hypothetical protein